MNKFKLRKLLKIISLVLLGLSVIGGIAALTTHLIKKDSVSIHPTFEVGGLNEQGRYEETKESLYTKEKFACEGLQATLDFDSQITYQIFYYDILDNFISSTDVLTEGYGEEAPLNGAYARIEITPTNDDDRKISFKEKLKYAKQLNLKVSKDAESNVSKKYVKIGSNLFTVVNTLEESVFELNKVWNEVQEEFGSSEKNAATTKTILDVSSYKTVLLKSSEESGMEGLNAQIYCYSSEMKLLGSHHQYPDGQTYTLPKGTKYAILVVFANNVDVNNAKTIYTFNK